MVIESTSNASQSSASQFSKNLNLDLASGLNSVNDASNVYEVSEPIEILSDNNNYEQLTLNSLVGNPEILLLEQIIADSKTPWQVHNCKILKQSVTQEEKLAFLYHYDSLTEEIKSQNPLTMTLLKNFNKPMFAKEAAQLLNISSELIKTPWQVKVVGTLVMFCESLQIALRLKFTNTAKQYDPIYTKTKEDALKISMEKWHFYGDVFVLNKNKQTLVMTLGNQLLQIPNSQDYQGLPAEFAIATLALLEEQKMLIPNIDEAIQARLL